MEVIYDNVKTKCLDLLDDKGKCVLTLRPAEGGAGLWITGPDGNVVSVFSVNGQTGVGIYSKKSLTDGGGMPVSLTVDEDGNGLIQLRDDEGVFWVRAADLRRLAAGRAAPRGAVRDPVGPPVG